MLVEILDRTDGQRVQLTSTSPRWTANQTADLQLRMAAIAAKLRGVPHPVQITFTPASGLTTPIDPDAVVTLTARIDRTDPRQMELAAQFLSSLSGLAAAKEGGT